MIKQILIIFASTIALIKVIPTNISNNLSIPKVFSIYIDKNIWLLPFDYYLIIPVTNFCTNLTLAGVFANKVIFFFSYFSFICSCYRTVLNIIRVIFSELLMFCDLFQELLDKWNNSKIWETRKTFANIAQDNVQ